MNSLLFRRSRFYYKFRAIKKAAPSKTVLPFCLLKHEDKSALTILSQLYSYISYAVCIPNTSFLKNILQYAMSKFL